MSRAQSICALCICALLAACGADGAPERPAAKTGLTVTGTATIGIARSGG